MFAKGKSGNPKGRPPIVEGQRMTFTETARLYAYETLDILKKIALDESERTANRIHACQILQDRGYGKCRDRTEDGPKSVDIVNYTKPQLLEIIARETAK